jgi:hypothetical protein
MNDDLNDDRESVAQALNSIVFIVSMISSMAQTPEHREEVEAEEATLWEIHTHIGLLLSYLKETRQAPSPAKLRVVK